MYLANDTVEGPSFVESGNFLPHCSEEPLRVEEASYPENFGSSMEDPLFELSVPFQQLSEPKTKSSRSPGGFLPLFWNSTHIGLLKAVYIKRIIIYLHTLHHTLSPERI